MSTYENVETITLIAGENLTDKKYAILTLNASGQAVVATAATAVPAGILGLNPNVSQLNAQDSTGKAVRVVELRGGIGLVKAAGTVTAGNLVTAAADGEAADAGGPGLDDLGANEFAIGRALEGAVADQVFRVQLGVVSSAL